MNNPATQIATKSATLHSPCSSSATALSSRKTRRSTTQKRSNVQRGNSIALRIEEFRARLKQRSQAARRRPESVNDLDDLNQVADRSRPKRIG